MRTWLQRVWKLFTDRQIWLRQILVAAIAAATAWAVGDALIPHGGLVAAIIASLSIRISLYKSVREGFGQILGTAIGAGVALLTVYFFHFGFIAVGITVLLCSVVAHGLHLGEVASVNVPVTALIVIGPGISENTALHRLYSTLVGAAIAIAFSYFSHPNTPAGRTIDQIKKLGAKASDLLVEMSEGVASGHDRDQSGNWLAKGRLLIEEIPNLRAQALEARRYAKWSPLAQAEEAEALYIREVAIEHTVVQVRGIARILFDSANEGGFPYEANRSIAVALSAASEAVMSKLDLTDGQYSINTIAQDLRESASTLTKQLISQAQLIEESQLVRAMAIVSNMRIMADSLEESSPALVEVENPEDSASHRVLKVSPADQTSRLSRKILKSIRTFLRR